MRRTFLKGMLGGGLAAVAGAPRAFGQSKVVKIGTIATAGTPWHKAMLRFKDLVEGGTGGRSARWRWPITASPASLCCTLPRHYEGRLWSAGMVERIRAA